MASAKPAEPGKLSGVSAWKLFDRGKDEWNKWAETHDGSTVDFTVSTGPRSARSPVKLDFSGFIFPGRTIFLPGFQFGGGAVFRSCEFRGSVSFAGAVFHGRFPAADFEGARFDDDADFTRVNFGVGASFREGVHFNGKTIFDDAMLGGADFEACRFVKDASFARTSFGENVNFRDARFCGGANFSDIVHGNPKGSLNFDGARFLGGAKFDGAKSEGAASFSGARFRSTRNSDAHVSFHGAEFVNGANFAGAIFECHAVFSQGLFNGPFNLARTEFWETADFGGSKFGGTVDLERAKFEVVPDFRRTHFDLHVTLAEMEVIYQKDQSSFLRRWPFRKASMADHADKYRRLKELAVLSRNHDREQEFFAFELRAMRFHQTGWLEFIPNLFYDLLSNMGRSIWRPLLGLVLVWVICGGLYQRMSGGGLEYVDSLIYSALRLLPFVKIPSGPLRYVEAAILGSGTPNAWGVTLVGAESVFGLILLFLLGLAVRNRFRV